MTKLSPSKLHLFQECPRCFWLDMVKGVKRPSVAFPSLPSGVDRVLKAHFDSFMAKGKLPPELVRHGVKARLFNDVELLSKWRNNLKGIEWLDTATGVLLHGAVDNLLVNGKKLIVLDYKTRGFPVKEDTAQHSQTQLDLYNFLLQKNGYETEDYAYLLFYMPKSVDEKGSFIFETELKKMKVDVKAAEKVFKEAITLIRGKEPTVNKECEWCGWQEVAW